MKKKNDSDDKVMYMPIFMSIGLSIGVAIGAATGNIPVAMCVGLSIGVGIGACLDAQNHKKEDDSSDAEHKEKK